MNNTSLQSIAAILACLIVGGAVAWAGSQGSALARGVPLFATCAVLAFGVNWAVFVPAYLFQTERYFDLTGSLTYLTLVSVAFASNGGSDLRSLLLTVLVGVWAVRLGTFLFTRIQRDGSDGRFDALKPDFLRFLMTWTLQGLWVFLTLACALAAMTSVTRAPLGALAALGFAVWLAGFSIEVVADHQKRVFRAHPANSDRFITTGLWAWSRHPNYLGEIMLWAGVAVISLPALTGWQLATLISPLFVFVLLTRISGIPLLESRAKKKWGDDPDFLVYRERTPVLLLRRPRSI